MSWLGVIVATATLAAAHALEPAAVQVPQAAGPAPSPVAAAHVVVRPAPAAATRRRPRQPGTPAVVDHVSDGDTIALSDGRKVRFVQVDTPEVYGSAECYGAQASATMKSWLHPGDRITLEADPALDQVDRYGRLLRYVWKDHANLNLRLVQVGAASVWYYGGARGRYAPELDVAVLAARRHGRGLWGRCAGTQLDTTAGVQTGRQGLAPSGGASGGGDSAGGAATGAGGMWGPARIIGHAHGLPIIADPPPDYDCSQLPGPVWVGSNDPHRLDRDGDGVGCEGRGA